LCEAIETGKGKVAQQEESYELTSSAFVTSSDTEELLADDE